MNSTTDELQSSFRICDELRHLPCRTFSSFVLLEEVASVVAQLSSQARQEPLLSYLPLGQLETHEPSSKCGVPVAGHVRHEKDPDEEHVSHEAWQERQWAWSLITLTKVPFAHSAMQVPLERKFSDPVELQERQSSASGPEQVPHEAAHGAQCEDEFAYFPTGVQSSRQR